MGLWLLIVLAEIPIPDIFVRAAEMLVALMLIAFGIWHLTRGCATAALSGRGATARSLVIGLFRGLAGSAGISLLPAAPIGSRPLAVAHLGLVAIGTVIGMVALTIPMSRPISWTMRRGGPLPGAIIFLAATLSIVLGLAVLVRARYG